MSVDVAMSMVIDTFGRLQKLLNISKLLQQLDNQTGIAANTQWPMCRLIE